MKIVSIKHSENFKTSHRKENHFYGGYTVVTMRNGKFDTPIDLRFYGTGSMNYACIWWRDDRKGVYSSGTGSAGGYGYDRESAAAFEAFANAGVEYSTRWGGMGNTMIREALELLARKLGYRKFTIVRSHA